MAEDQINELNQRLSAMVSVQIILINELTRLEKIDKPELLRAIEFSADMFLPETPTIRNQMLFFANLLKSEKK